MAATFNPQAAADQARNAYRNVTAQLGLALDTAIPEALGAVAEKTVDQTREAYDRSKDALEASIAGSKDHLMRRGGALRRSTIKSSTSPSGT